MAAILRQGPERRMPARHARFRLPAQRQQFDFWKCTLVFVAVCSMCSFMAQTQQQLSEKRSPEDSKIEILASAWLQQPRGVIHGG